MKTSTLERGQALILIVFAIVGLVAVTGLAVDGGMAYSDRRNAQNAADASALAGALAHIRGRDPVAAATSSAIQEGFDNNGTTNRVSVTVANLGIGHCPNLMTGKDITVQISSRSTTYFAPVLGIRQINNTVHATARSCDSYVGPIFPGDAIVALAPSGIGFDAAGTPNWAVYGGGIFSNSAGTPSARCKGASDVLAPSLTTVGSVNFQCAAEVHLTTTGAPQLKLSDYSGLLPEAPECNGVAKKVGNYWVAQSGAKGSDVAFSGDMKFGPGLYCVTNSPGPFHGSIQGSGVTFYLKQPNFSMKLSGGGSFTATAPLSGDYMGLLMFSEPQVVGGVLQSTQSIDLRGNGTAGDSKDSIVGSIIVPSANVTMFGNSNSNGYSTQIIAYHVDSGGTANITIHYNSTVGFQTNQPAWLTLLR